MHTDSETPAQAAAITQWQIVEFTIPLRNLKAVAAHASRGEVPIRNYVVVEVRDGEVYCFGGGWSTHAVMKGGRVTTADQSAPADFHLAIPIHVLDLLRPKRWDLEHGEILLQPSSSRDGTSNDERWRMVYLKFEQVFEPREVSNRQWREIVPKQVSAEAAVFDLDLFNLFLQSARVLNPRDKQCGRLVRVGHNGEGPALVEIEMEPNFFGVIMPLRSTHGMTHLTSPDWAREREPEKSLTQPESVTA
ncbi:MAG: hypothetical protein ACYC9L_02965 [Sulfuricaulis sp.]